MASSLNNTSNSTVEELNSKEISDSYEKEIEYLIQQLTRIDSDSSNINTEKDYQSSYSHWYLSNKLLNNNEERRTFIDQLRQEFIRVNSLVVEANTMSEEMHRQIVYSVILQIPSSYLKPSEHSIENLYLPAVQVKRENLLSQIWSVEKFESRLKYMKDLYITWIVSENKADYLEKQLKRSNPFFDEKFESFIGIANIYLKALFFNSKLDFIVPIINSQGEMSGSLCVVIEQTGLSPTKTLKHFQIDTTTYGSKSDGINTDSDKINPMNNQHTSEDETIDDSSILENKPLIVKFSIKEARDLPKSNAEYVMCRYTFINPKLDQNVISEKASSVASDKQKLRKFSFNHENEYIFPITDELLATCSESALSIEVWYQHSPKLNDITMNTNVDQRFLQVREIAQQWRDVKRHIQFSVEILELDSTGEWTPVTVDANEKLDCGGLYRLKQGQSKRLVTKLRLVPRSDPMPLVLREIRSVEIGSISARKIQAPLQLDSYQEEDLQRLREKWFDFIRKRKMYLESQINMLNQEKDKQPIDTHKESVLLEELARLAEEHDIALFPPAGSGIPGSPAAWDPPYSIEMHRPIIFLDIDLLDTSNLNKKAGIQTKLIEEEKTPMFQLPLIQRASDETFAIAQWDPTIHGLPTMNQITSNDTIIYLIVKIIVIIAQPIHMELVLRKRIAITINKPEESWPEKTIKSFLGSKTYKATSVVYEIVSQIPKNLHDIEDREKIDFRCLSNVYIDRYLQYGSTIDFILLLDKLRQEVLLKINSVKEKTVRKSTSVPNITHQAKNKDTVSSFANIHRETHDNQLLNNSNEALEPVSKSEWNSSTPSMISRSMFIEEEQLQPMQKSILQIKHTIDLDHDIDDNNKKQENTNTIEEISTLLSSQSSESLTKQTINNNEQNEHITVGLRVVINTGNSICNKIGTVRFVGDTLISAGIWYGIELDEPVGKNNGSIYRFTYFICPDKHGVFVRRDKIHLFN